MKETCKTFKNIKSPKILKVFGFTRKILDDFQCLPLFFFFFDEILEHKVQTHSFSRCEVLCRCCSLQFRYLHVVASSWRTRQCRSQAARATTQIVASARTSERRHGLGREQPPHSPKGTGEARAGGEREQNHTPTIWKTPPFSSRSSSSCRSTKSPVGCGLTASLMSGRRSGICSSASTLLFSGRLSQCPRSCRHPVLFARLLQQRRWRSSWGSVSGLQQPVKQTVDISAPGAGGFAGCRSLQGFFPRNEVCPAFAFCQADRRHFSSWRWWFRWLSKSSRFFSQKRGLPRLRLLSSRTSTLECLVVVRLDMEVFEVFPQIRVPQRLAQFRLMSRFNGFFRTFPRKKLRSLAGR